MIRQDLDDDSKEIMAAEHGTGMVHLAVRAEKTALIKDMQFRMGGSLLQGVMPKRIGIEKHGDDFSLFISVEGEPMHQYGPSIHLHLDAPFYVGIGFCSHLPVTPDIGVFSGVLLANRAGKLQKPR
ncbi:MAG: biopolymer transporter Tol [Acidobacteria bacterium]|nr:biopolymer transporter Tol [Acidobacteriota bacterium]